MEVQFSPEQKKRIERLAAGRKADASTFLSQIVACALEYEEWLIREVDKGFLSLDRSEFTTQEELEARIEQRLNRK